MTRGIVIFVLSVVKVLASEPFPVDAPYHRVFEPWRACMTAEALAKQGAPDALRTIYLAAYVRLNQPFPGGEDLEGMHDIFDRVLVAVGDVKFSRSLALQRPEIRSAVRHFLSSSAALKKSSKTAKLLREAPAIYWPLDKVTRDSR
jgi:hypothetical protein